MVAPVDYTNRGQAFNNTDMMEMAHADGLEGGAVRLYHNCSSHMFLINETPQGNEIELARWQYAGLKEVDSVATTRDAMLMMVEEAMKL